MKLYKAEILNFRSIRSVNIEFTPFCRVLVGINESGKSNILTALSHLDLSLPLSVDDVRQAGKNESPITEARIRFIFRFNTEEKEQLLEAVRQRIHIARDAVIFTCASKKYTLEDVCKSRNEGLISVNLMTRKKTSSAWTLPSSWKPSEKIRKIPSGAVLQLKIDGTLHQASASSLIHVDLHPEQAESFPAATLADIQTILTKATTDIVEQKLPTVVHWKYSEENLLPSEVSLEGFESDPEICIPLMHMFSLAGLSDPSAAITEAKARSNGLENLLERVADSTTRHLRDVWKEMRGVSVELRENGPHIRCRLRDEQNAYNFSRRSDGFKRFFTFLLMISAVAKTENLTNTLYLHDEPEIGLHPSGARYLRDELISVSNSNDNIVVYSTHSIFMIDRDCPDRHLIVKKSNEITTVTKAEKSEIAEEEVLYQALGSSIFESLQQENIIFEGWRDRKLFHTAINSAKGKKNTAIQPLIKAGTCFSDGLKDISRVAMLLSLANRRCVIISDGDAPAKQHQRQFADSNPEAQWIRYDLVPEFAAQTAEDFLKSTFVLECLEAVLDNEALKKPGMSECLLNSELDKLANIKRWLLSQGINAEQCKNILSRLKTSLFTGITSRNISDHYFTFLEEAAKNYATQG